MSQCLKKCKEFKSILDSKGTDSEEEEAEKGSGEEESKAEEEGLDLDLEGKAKVGLGKAGKDSGQDQGKAAITAAGTWRTEAEGEDRRNHFYPKLFKPLRFYPLLRCQRLISS